MKISIITVVWNNKETIRDFHIGKSKIISPPAYKIEAILTQTSGDTETY